MDIKTGQYGEYELFIISEDPFGFKGLEKIGAKIIPPFAMITGICAHAVLIDPFLSFELGQEYDAYEEWFTNTVVPYIIP